MTKQPNPDHAGAKETSLYHNIVAACKSQEMMSLPTKVGHFKMSLGVDTGATVNLLSIESYVAIKRKARGERWSLRPSDLNLRGLTGSALEVVSMVTLPVIMHKSGPAIRLIFYVVTNLNVPTDGILRLTLMKANGIDVRHSTNSVMFKWRSVLAMD